MVLQRIKRFFHSNDLVKTGHRFVSHHWELSYFLQSSLRIKHEKLIIIIPRCVVYGVYMLYMYDSNYRVCSHVRTSHIQMTTQINYNIFFLYFLCPVKQDVFSLTASPSSLQAVCTTHNSYKPTKRPSLP